MPSDVFGELPKDHKCKSKYSWKKNGLITDDIDAIYDRYIESTNCEKCGAEYKSRTDRCMDHCHQTGAFRNILCQNCNKNTDRTMLKNNTSGYTYIFSRFEKRSCNEYWVVRIDKQGKKYGKELNKKKYTIQQAVELRDSILENWD